jgi:hypothetical protein
MPDTKDKSDRLRADLEARLSQTRIEVIQAQAREISFEAVVEDLLK